VGITVGNGRMVGGVENNNIIDQFEHMFNAAMSNNIEKCICRTAWIPPAIANPPKAQCPTKIDRFHDTAK